MSDDNPTNDSVSDNKPHFELYIKVCNAEICILRLSFGASFCFYISEHIFFQDVFILFC